MNVSQSSWYKEYIKQARLPRYILTSVPATPCTNIHVDCKSLIQPITFTFTLQRFALNISPTWEHRAIISGEKKVTRFQVSDCRHHYRTGVELIIVDMGVVFKGTNVNLAGLLTVDMVGCHCV